jgi:hypothetical protein
VAGVTSYRDLAEADAYHRRRLVNAFVSGTSAPPGGDPPRSGRCVIGGLVLAAVLVAVTAASEALTGHPAIDWDHGIVRISR